MDRYALIAGHDPSVLQAYRSALRQLGYQIELLTPAGSPAHPFSVAVVDARVPAGLSRLCTLAGRALCIGLTTRGLEDAVLEAGADEALTTAKPTPETLQGVLERAEARVGRSFEGPFGAIIGRSPPLVRIFGQMQQYARSSSTVLLRGETGTGKEVFARAIHRLSPRAQGPFVAVNCAAIPESLLESQLFGHARGAFTSAHAARPGSIAAAEGGTLFLDEVSEIPATAQAKLLRVLQEREYTPVGETIARKSNVRVVAATNRDLEQDVRSGRFRADLYWRLEVITLELPPLRVRHGDVSPLCYHFMDRTNHGQQRQVSAIAPAAQQLLLEHSWPGNVRELENTIERAVLLRQKGVLQPADIILRRPTPPEVLGQVRLPPDGLNLAETTAALELLLIDQALKQSGGNQAEAARLLNIHRTTLIQKLRRREEATR